MRYFKEQLDKAYKYNINVIEVHCAYVVNRDIAELSDKEFEAIAHFVYDWVLHSHATPEDIVLIISDGIANDDIKREMFLTSKGIAFITEYVNNRI